jgi:deoxyribose-phosphate aldolase
VQVLSGGAASPDGSSSAVALADGGTRDPALVLSEAHTIRVTPTLSKLASLIDHTLLRPEVTQTQIEKCCDEALHFGFAAVHVNLTWVPLAARKLSGSPVKVGTVNSFPLGATSTAAKRAEAQVAILVGAQEIDMVMNIGAMRSGDFVRVESDIRGVVEVCHTGGAILKVILETAFLSDEQKVAASRIVKQAGADFVKTATGLGPSGATVADVRLIRQTVGLEMGVKAAGYIRSLSAVLSMLEAGANRLGTSGGVAILTEAARLEK